MFAESVFPEEANQSNAWVQAASSGDLVAFNHLVLAHQDDLYGWIFSLVKDEALADDITQSTLITAYQKLPAFRGGSFRAWLFKIARNRSIDAFRQSRRHLTISLDAPLRDAEDNDFLSLLPSAEPFPEKVIEQAEQASILHSLLETLPESFQQVLRLVDMQGLDYREAAEVLGLPIGTLKSRLARGRLKLRDLLFKSGYLS